MRNNTIRCSLTIFVSGFRSTQEFFVTILNAFMTTYNTNTLFVLRLSKKSISTDDVKHIFTETKLS
jgi:hypothetical protein